MAWRAWSSSSEITWSSWGATPGGGMSTRAAGRAGGLLGGGGRRRLAGGRGFGDAGRRDFGALPAAVRPFVSRAAVHPDLVARLGLPSLDAVNALLGGAEHLRQRAWAQACPVSEVVALTQLELRVVR